MAMLKTRPIAFIAFALVAAATPATLAQARQPDMSAARAAAIHECSAREAQYKEYTWGRNEIYAYRSCMSEYGQPE